MFQGLTKSLWVPDLSHVVFVVYSTLHINYQKSITYMYMYMKCASLLKRDS